MRLKFLLGVLLIVLSGCGVEPLSTESSSNPKLDIDVIGVYKGYEIIRFMDGGYFRYAVIKDNGADSDYQVSSGKTSRPESVSSAW